MHIHVTTIQILYVLLAVEVLAVRHRSLVTTLGSVVSVTVTANVNEFQMRLMICITKRHSG